DGMEATRKIRQMCYSGVILGVTGNGLRSDIDRFLASGADTVLLKPLNVVKFEAALN
ncbi:RR41, partial [Symbiodinium microadriaticum]